MSKQVAAGQSGMYSTSGGMTAPVQQHHQSAMGLGQIPPPPQSSSMVQQGQQMNRMNPLVPVNISC